MVYITNVYIDGFASFKDFSLDLSEKENIIVGTNGVGKTNFLNIIDMTLSDHTKLKDIIDDRAKKTPIVEIHLMFNDNEVIQLNKLCVLYFLNNLIENQKYYYISIESIIEQLSTTAFFDYGVTISCQQKKKQIERTINICCDVCNQTHVLNVYGMNQCCVFEKIKKYFSTINNVLISVYNEHLIDKTVDKIKERFTHDGIDYKFNDLNDIILGKCNTINNTYTLMFNKYDDYKSNYYINHLKSIINDDIKDVINFINLHRNPASNQNESYGDITANTLFDDMLKNNCKFDIIIGNYINNLVAYLELNEYIKNSDIYEKLIEYENNTNDNMESITVNTQHTSSYTTIKPNMYSKSNQIVEHYNHLNTFFKEINHEHNIREQLFNIKNRQYDTFIIIQNIFQDITGKKFDILQENQNVNDYEYIIDNDDYYYSCSNGERELIDFLTTYHCYESNIILIDEPCAHLSSQNKINFRNKFMSNDIDKQIIIITHDIELVSPENSNLIHFSMSDGESTEVVTKFVNKNNAKNITEHIELLFSSKCLFVEGYHDYRFMKVLTEKNNIYEYNIIPMNGCKSSIWKLCDDLHIPYKIIFDFDVIMNYFEGNRNEKIETIIGNEYDALYKENTENCEITCDTIINVYNDINMKKLYFLHLSIFVDTLNVLLTDNKLEKWYPSQDKLSNKISGKSKTETYDEIKQNKTNKTTSYYTFQSKYKELWEKIIIEKKYDMTHFNHTSSEFLTRFHKAILFHNDHKDELLFFDHIIETKLQNNNILMWTSGISDIEGVMTKIKYGNDINNKFTKPEWKQMSCNDIKNEIIATKDANVLDEIIIFINKK